MQTETVPSKGKNKVNHMAGLESVKSDFSRIGDLREKLKRCKSGAEKADVRNNYHYDLAKVKKMIKVFKVEVLKDEDTKTHAALLTWERQRGLISVSDEYKLNAMEAATLEESCECFQAPPSGLRCELGGKYKHTMHYDEARKKDMYVTYMPVIIAPESQIGRELEWKISQGFMPEMKDYPSAKVLWHRRLLVDSEWRRYFREL